MIIFEAVNRVSLFQEKMKNNKTFVENLDKLIELFGKLKNNSRLESLSGVDRNFLENFEAISKNYQQIKDDVPLELINQFGEPIEEMVSQMVEQLKQELSEENQDCLEELDDALFDVDLRLRDPELTDNEVDKLLDLRSRLVRDKKSFL